MSLETEAKELSADSVLSDEISPEGVTVVDYYKDGCGPCKMISPFMDQLAKIEGVKVIKVNGEVHSQLAFSEGISTVPTLHFYKDGEMVKSSGPAPIHVLKNIIQSL